MRLCILLFMIATQLAMGQSKVSYDPLSKQLIYVPVPSTGGVSIFPLRSVTGNDSYAATIPAITSYTNTCVLLNADTANVGTATVNINGLGAKNVLGPTGGALADGDIPANLPKLMCYDGTQFVLQGGGGSGVNGGGGGAGLTIGTVDFYIDMNTSTPGTALTGAILAAGTVGSANTSAELVQPDPSVYMSVGAHAANRALGGSVIVDEVSYPTSHTSQSIRYDHTGAHNRIIVATPSPSSHVAETGAGWITFGPPKVISSGSSQLFDYVGTENSLGDFVVVQLNNGGGPGACYCVNMESNPNHVTTHTETYITVVPGNTYWASFKANYATGKAQLSLYNPSFVQVGPTLTADLFIGNAEVHHMFLGNNENGTAPGYSSYFENWVFAYTNPVFPLGPTAQ